MSLINIINESFDKRNKSILTESKGKKLKEAVEKYNNLDAIIITSELIDEVFKELRRKKIKPVAIYANNSELFIFIDTTKTLNSAFTLIEDNYTGIAEEYSFEDNVDQLKALENTDEWIEKLKEWCYLEPWLGTVYEYDGEVISYDTETLLRESVESNSKNIKKDSKFLDNFNGHSDELDRFYDYMFEAAKDLGFQDFDAFDDGWTVTLTYIDSVGNKQQAEFDFDDELSFESKEDAIDCLMSLDWKVVDDEDEDLDENTQAKKLECKSKNLTEAQGDFNPATLKKYGVVRDPANDFVDDGNRFTAYLYKGVIPISYLKSKGQVYLSIAFHDLDDVNYDEYKNFESYQDGDKYNGVPADSVDIEDFVSILERAKKDYEEFKASVKAPNIDDYKAFRKVYADYFKKVLERAKKLIADNIDTIADLSDYELKKIFEYYKSIKFQLSRWINDDAISQMSPSAIRHDLSSESIERQKKQIANVDDYFYLRYIRDYIEGDKAK